MSDGMHMHTFIAGRILLAYPTWEKFHIVRESNGHA